MLRLLAIAVRFLRNDYLLKFRSANVAYPMPTSKTGVNLASVKPLRLGVVRVQWLFR